MKKRTIILLVKIMLRGFLGAFIIGMLLFTVLSDIEPLRIAIHKDYSVEEANDYNVFLGTVFVESEVAVDSKGDDVISDLLHMIFSALPTLSYGLNDKTELPDASVLNSSASGTIVTYKGQTGILTAVHCVDRLPPNMEMRSIARLDFQNEILGINGTDIVFVPFFELADSSILSRAILLDESISMQQGNECYFSYFKILNGEREWTYRKFSGDLQMLNDDQINDLFLEDFELDMQKELFIEVNAFEYPDCRAQIIYVADSLLSVYKEFREIWRLMVQKTPYGIEVTEEQFNELPGASGSALLNYDGEIIGVTSFRIQKTEAYYSTSSKKESRYYLFFVPVFNLP